MACYLFHPTSQVSKHSAVTVSKFSALRPASAFSGAEYSARDMKCQRDQAHGFKVCASKFRLCVVGLETSPSIVPAFVVKD
jgi:hypothetical protein